MRLTFVQSIVSVSVAWATTALRTADSEVSAAQLKSAEQWLKRAKGGSTWD